MRLALLLLSLHVTALLASEGRAAEAIKPAGEVEQAKAARALLDAWHATEPQPGERSLHLVCWTPKDREFPANYEARLGRIMTDIQSFYAREMESYGLGERTITLPRNAAGEMVIHSIRGQQKAAHYGKQSGREIRQECRGPLREAGVDVDQETIVIFCNLAQWNADKLRFTHESPYYAGGSARGGTAWQLDSPELDIPNLRLKEPLIHDGQYGRISLGKHNSIFIGGIAHELGHALGLPHNAPRPDQKALGTPLMGSGNRTYGDQLRNEGKGSFLTLAHALRLASHPQFSGSVKGLEVRAKSEFSELALEVNQNRLCVSGKLSATPPVYAIVGYVDPEGGGDYNATTVTTLPNKDGSFSLCAEPYFRGKAGQFRLALLHVNGDVTTRSAARSYQFDFEVDQAGKLDATDLLAQLELAPLLQALQAGDQGQAKLASEQLSNPKAKQVAAALLQREAPTQTPAEYNDQVESVSLTQTKPQEAKVGWIRPTYDRLPDDRNPLVLSGGKLYATGIYAHAPARHVYHLGKKWQRLTGEVGLAAGHRGSVEFQIKGDGRLLWKSPLIRVDAINAFHVDVSQVDNLELLTLPTADGSGADWGLWLEPQLQR